MHQAILPSTQTPLAEISILHLHCSTSVVFSWLLPSRLFERPLSLLISGGDLLVFGSHDLGFFNLLQ